MPANNIKETGSISRDPELINNNYELYQELVNDAQDFIYPLPDGGQRPKGVFDAAFYYDRLITHLNTVLRESKDMAEDNVCATINSIHNYSEYNKSIIEDIDKIFELEKDPDSELNAGRTQFLKDLHETVVRNHETSAALEEKLTKELQDELFGETMKTFNDANPFSSKGFENFVGPKYHEKAERTKNAVGFDFSTDRTGAVSISMMALINEGMDFDTLTDPDKELDRKQAMFDKVTKMIQKGGPGSKEWIADALYNGQKKTTQMISDVAKTIDFSKNDLLNDKRYCQLLHLNFAQFDAWQEMAHCQPELIALAQKDDPQLNNYQKIKDHFRDMQSPLVGVRKAVNATRSSCVSMADFHDPALISSNTKNAVCFVIVLKLVLLLLILIENSADLKWITANQSIINPQPKILFICRIRGRGCVVIILFDNAFHVAAYLFA